ncbi:MAG: hypothetical protein KJ737_20490 [Proteobacteria bacterium]|nr:hypothetical protein [Pseudomonadota bacterium]
MKEVKNSDSAKTAYQKRQENIAEKIEHIQTKLKKEPQGKLNWAHVGSLGHVEELLKEIDHFLS